MGGGFGGTNAEAKNSIGGLKDIILELTTEIAHDADLQFALYSEVVMYQNVFSSILAFAFFTCCSLTASGQVTNASHDVPLNIKKEPLYTGGKPVYAMAAFGSKQERPIWMVLDKAEPDAKTYDKLFVDLNADGDLTGENELFPLIDKDGERLAQVDLPDIKVSDQSKFSKVSVSIRSAKVGECMFKATWNDQIKFAGGYPETGSDGYMRFSPDPQDAPIVFFKGDVPFEFQPWYPSAIPVSGETDFKVFMGHCGKGPSSFCTTMGHILDDDEPVLATLVYVNVEGTMKRADVKLAERC